ncbi:hypothetical protein D3C73_1338620 [compost metagenome]
MDRTIEHVLLVVVNPQLFKAQKQIIRKSRIILGQRRQPFQGTDYVIAEIAYTAAMKRR